DTAPYIQYAYARASRILEKSGIKPTTDVDFSLLQETSELNLVKTIGLFNLQVRDAA
ncbi:MAG TPA: arginine--tRNA ligase, partial [Nitrosopumilus sp.]|nr:arginine--tRNA ligase [Nitrosopumilus sp.]